MTKKENPYGVKAGQKWKNKTAPLRKFTVLKIERYQIGVYAKVDYGDLVSLISVTKFDRYERCE